MTDGIRPIPSDLTNAVYDFCHDDVVEIFSKPSKKERNSDRALLWEKIEKRFLTEAEQPELDMAVDKFSVRRAYHVHDLSAFVLSVDERHTCDGRRANPGSYGSRCWRKG